LKGCTASPSLLRAAIRASVTVVFPEPLWVPAMSTAGIILMSYYWRPPLMPFELPSPGNRQQRILTGSSRETAMLVGVVKRGKYGERLIETLKERTDFGVVWTEVPAILPGFIEDPVDFVQSLNLDPRVFQADLLILYTFHPDLTPEIIRLAGAKGVKAAIVPGGMARAGSIGELQRLARKYGIYIEVDEICCTLEKCGVEPVDIFAEKLGWPELKFRLEGGRISQVEVQRGSPCGGTWHVAEGLVNSSAEEAPALAGLLCQQYPCRAVRGTPGGIHTSADLHKNAALKALGGQEELVLPLQSRSIKIYPDQRGGADEI
jgi:hypothetical protein